MNPYVLQDRHILSNQDINWIVSEFLFLIVYFITYVIRV